MEDNDLPDTIKLIGTESQTIHLILKKNEKININKNYVLYVSSENLDEIIYKNVDSLLMSSSKTNKAQLKKVENENIVRLKNKENNIEYVGLSRGGKILKITPILHSNLFVKIESILAFNDGIELLKDKDIDSKMRKLNRRNNLQFGAKDLLENFLFNKTEYGLVRTRVGVNCEISKDQERQSLLNMNSYLSDFVYISGKKNLIEKRLGEGETMVIIQSSLIAFEQSITFNTIKKSEKKDKYVNNWNDIVVEGPGLIIFEFTDRKIPIYNPMVNRVILIFTICFFLLELLVQLSLHYNLRQ